MFNNKAYCFCQHVTAFRHISCDSRLCIRHTYERNVMHALQGWNAATVRGFFTANTNDSFSGSVKKFNRH